MKVVTFEVRGVEYAKGIGCKSNHDGSDRYTHTGHKNYWACEGCGCAELEEDLADRQRKAGVQ